MPARINHRARNRIWLRKYLPARPLGIAVLAPDSAKDHETLYAYSLLGIVMYVRKRTTFGRSVRCRRHVIGRLRDLSHGSWRTCVTDRPRRLRRKQIIHRIEGGHRYQLTRTGRAVALLFTKTYRRILGPGLAALDPALPSDLARRSSPARLESPRYRARPIHRHGLAAGGTENLI